MTRLAGRLAALSGWRRLLAAVLLGAGAALALPPFHFFPFLVVAFTGLVWLLDGAGRSWPRFLIGWAFGLGFFVTGLYWTGFSMLVDAERFAAFIPLAVLVLPACLAVYIGLATLAAGWLAPFGHARIAALAAAWGLGEFLRGTLFTGFPWNLIGYAWTASDATMQAAAFVGVYALGVVTVWAAAAPAALVSSGGGWSRARHAKPHLAVAILAAVALMGAGMARLAAAPETGDMARFDGVRLRIVQASIPQHLKWHPDHRDDNLLQHIQMSAGPGAEAVTHVIWPEAAIPFFIGNDPRRRALVATVVPEGGLLLTGVPRRTPPGAAELKLWNSLVGIDGTARTVFVYDKIHLLPFGEYLPFRSLLSVFGLDKLAVGSVDYSAGMSESAPIAAPGLPPFRALICYEAVFPGEIAPGATAETARPTWLLNITNDAWFGDSPGPYQHLAMARVRAVEQGVALVRAANTGISALVDPYGRIIRTLGLGQRGVLDGGLIQPLPAAPVYTRWGDGVFWSIVAFLIIISATARKFLAPEGADSKKSHQS